jgi:hypothetical protein
LEDSSAEETHRSRKLKKQKKSLPKPLPPPPKLDQRGKNALNIQDQYINNIKYGITSIDTNLPLKRFICKQNEKKNLSIDQTKKDIAMFMENFCNQKRESEKQA